MDLSELITYAEAIYHIREERRWADGPDLSVLSDPRTGKTVALLMRQWDTETGSLIERCDIRCGPLQVPAGLVPWITEPVRMRGTNWRGLILDDRTDPEVVFRLLDRAMDSGRLGVTVVLEDDPAPAGPVYHDTPLPFAAGLRPKPKVPEVLRELRRMFRYGSGSPEEAARNFLRQGRFMADYEDDVPWQGDFLCYLPTYHDMNTRQLRGYFTWRAAVRRGVYERIPPSAAYLYVYELLNGIGTGSPEESLSQLDAFADGYLDGSPGDERMRKNIRRWQLELAIVKQLPPETLRRYADPELLEGDEALFALKNPGEHSDEAVFAALCRWGGKKLAQSPVVTGDPARGMRLFSETWRIACAGFRENGRSLFPLCFGDRQTRRWYPMDNAVYCMDDCPAELSCALDPVRTYTRKNGTWQVRSYLQQNFDRNRFRSFLHETELRLRHYLKAGRALREQPEGAWARPFAEAAIADDRRAVEEAARPVITIDPAGLDRIRSESLTTRDSLLIGEDPAPETGSAAAEAPESPAAAPRAPAPGPKIPAGEPAAGPAREAEGTEGLSRLLPDPTLAEVLRTLLRGESPAALLRANHIMPSVAADAINEALYDELGDAAVVCEDDVLAPVEDYLEDLNALLGGTQ